MRLKSAGVSGIASGSCVAAALRCASLIASNRLQSCFGGLAIVFMVLSAFMRFGSSGRYDANGLAPHAVGDIEQAAIHHADDDIAVFAIVFTVIQPLDGERVFENIPRHFKGDAMIGFVACRLDSVPFEF